MAKKYILYIDDDQESRKEGLAAIESRRLENVLCPTTAKELDFYIKEYEIIGAIIDFRLVKWVNRDNSAPVIIADEENYDGIDIARQISKTFPTIRIGLFSSNEIALKQKLNLFPVNPKFKVISQDGMPVEDINKFIPDFIEEILESVDESIEVSIKIKPLHKDLIAPTQAAKVYLSKKIMQANPDHVLPFWKMGEFTWMAAVNKDLQFVSNEEINAAGLTSANNTETFIIKIDQSDYRIKEMCINEGEVIIKKSEVLIKITDPAWQIPSSPKYDWLIHMIVARFICDLFLDERLSSSRQAIVGLRKLSQSAVLESQKILFTEYSKMGNIKTKEQVYSALREFANAELPKVLEVFHGVVDEVDDKIAHVSLVSKSPEHVERKEEFKFSLLNKEYGLQKDSEFEYTVYKPAFGGFGYHIEPI